MNSEAQAVEVDTNYDAFVRMLSSLLPEHRDRWALMRHGEVVQTFDRVGQAFDEGRSRYREDVFSIQEVTDEPIDLGFWSHVAQR